MSTAINLVSNQEQGLDTQGVTQANNPKNTVQVNAVRGARWGKHTPSCVLRAQSMIFKDLPILQKPEAARTRCFRFSEMNAGLVEHGCTKKTQDIGGKVSTSGACRTLKVGGHGWGAPRLGCL